MRVRLFVVLLALVVAPVAHAQPGLLVGVDDDLAKWLRSPRAPLSVERALGLRAVRFSVGWHRGESTLPAPDRTELARAVTAAYGLRVVLSVTGPARDAPLDDVSRDEYCGFVRRLVQQFPTVNDVVIWNEPNSGTFWKPQSDAPAQYEALLARCWDVLHAYRPSVNVIDSTAPHARGKSSTAPAAFIRGMGKAYRASGRTQRILDTVGHHPYPDTDAESPARAHPKSSSIGEGDLGKLTAALRDAFKGTAQPLPGSGGVTIWYLEDGFQSSVPSDEAAPYRGVESDRSAVDPAAQAEQLGTAVRLAYCQLNVAAFFNFQLVDERDLAGWQSGILFADGSQKPAYAELARTVAAVNSGSVSCAPSVR
jgi:hypothetical protein